MTFSKRLFDIFFAILFLLPLLPGMLVIALVILLKDGRPILYRAERMKTPKQSFRLWKFRTMRVVAADSGVTGPDKADRITKTGAFLRRYRMDEWPQLWNILRGDMSFVGPRPPLRRYVVKYPALYRQVLQAQPGVTGLATVLFHRHEEILLSGCKTAAATERVYCNRCVPRKARLDLIYQERATRCLDVLIIIKTLFRSMPIK